MYRRTLIETRFYPLATLEICMFIIVSELIAFLGPRSSEINHRRLSGGGRFIWKRGLPRCFNKTSAETAHRIWIDRCVLFCWRKCEVIYFEYFCCYQWISQFFLCVFKSRHKDFWQFQLWWHLNLISDASGQIENRDWIDRFLAVLIWQF